MARVSASSRVALMLQGKSAAHAIMGIARPITKRGVFTGVLHARQKKNNSAPPGAFFTTIGAEGPAACSTSGEATSGEYGNHRAQENRSSRRRGARGAHLSSRPPANPRAGKGAGYVGRFPHPGRICLAPAEDES